MAETPGSAGPARTTVVGVGASAGGLQALRAMFAAVPADSGIAWVVVVHLPPEHESHLAELLQPHTPIPVLQVRELTPLEPDQVYVIPPGRNLAAVDSHLRVTPLEEDRRDRAPIDHFFRTLSSAHDGHSVAVILSGTGSDGALGARHIQERGGVVVVQDPNEAEFDEMPRSALDTGIVDLVLPVAEIPRRILELDRMHPEVQETPGSEAGSHRDLVHRVLAQVRARTGQDFSRYKGTTVERRIQRRMQILGVRILRDYLDLLRESPQESVALAEDLLINVTSFFRDREVFEFLAQEVIPGLFDGKSAHHRVRVWSVGCATGEEAYSLAMLLLEEAARQEHPPQVQVFATDLHERSLQHAREGLYPETIVADVSPERLERFFQEENRGYRVCKELRDTVVFAPHNLLRDPPFSHLDLVSCRNVLIYLQRDVQEEVVELFHYALHGEGYLLLGTAETLDRSELFRVESKEHHLYRRRNAARAELRVPILPLAPARRTGPAAEPHPRPEAPPGGYGPLHQTMVERYAPPSLLLNQEHAVLHVSESAGRYLQVPGGAPTSNVFKLVREELRMELRATLHLAGERRQPTRSKPIPVRIEGEPRHVVLRVSPAGTGEMEGLALVIFDEVAATLPAGATQPGPEEAVVRELEAELDMTRSRLQAILEEFESSQEEMRASNEELQSANEELRSTMEELETSREELQSTNEELQTLNQENRHKVEELSQLSSDLQNLLRVTDAATLFLDRSLRIVRFTPKVGELFNIRQTDRGRPLADLTHRLGYGGLLQDARRVLESLGSIEREVESEDGRWNLVRVVPYRTVEDRIEGVVITLVDVSTIKRSEQAARESEERHRLIVESALDYAIFTMSPEGRIESWSPGAEAVLGWTAEEAIGQPAEITYTPEERERGVAAKEREIARRDGSAPDVRWHLRRDGTEVFIDGVARAMHDDEGGVRGFLKIGQDVTQRRQTEAALRASDERFRIVVNLIPDLLWEHAADGAAAWYNDRWYAYTGQAPGDVDRGGWEDRVHPDDQGEVQARYRAALASGEPYRGEYRIRGADGAYRWFLVHGEPVRGASGHPLRWFGAATDIHEQRVAREELEDRVRERTRELARSNEALAAEIAERERAEQARRAVLRQLVTAEEDERRRISRELHDQMGQQLTGLLLALNALEREVDAPEQEPRFRALEQLADSIARDMQSMALELRPPALDNLGLKLALQGHADDWSARHGVEVDFHSTGMDDVRLPREVETTLYRVVQEGLTNVLKHAGATHVSLVLERRRDMVSVILEDDGHGFAVEETLASPLKARRLGLRGMRERVILLGGTLDIESSPGEGTTLFVRIPVASAIDPASAPTSDA